MSPSTVDGGPVMESAKGIFATPANHGLALRARNRRIQAQKLNDFAELLAEGLTPARAAVKLGHLPSYGPHLLRRIKAKLGWQAQ